MAPNEAFQAGKAGKADRHGPATMNARDEESPSPCHSVS